MASLGRGELKVRIDAQGFVEFLAAGAFARRSTMNEGQMFVRVRALPIRQAKIDRRLEVAGGLGIFAVLVLAKAARQRGGPFARLDEITQRLGGAARQRDEGGEKQRARSHRKRCRILT